MRRVIFFALLSAAIVAGACEEPPPEETAPLGSRVELAAGEVWLAAEDGKERLITGAMLPETATVEVGEGARALVRLGSGIGVFLRGGSRVELGGGEVALLAGEMWADVPSDERELGRFRAGEVAVTASGAGLDLALGEGGSAAVYVARGLAVVASPGGRSEVASGERARASGKGAPEVEPVDYWEDWTGGMADRELLAGSGGRGTGRIYGIDRERPGSPPGELQILSQDVRVHVRDGVAHTTVDQRFFNPSSTPLEGWYWFTVPEGASVERFALEVSGALVEGEMVERKRASAAYEEAVARSFDPALLEWVDGRTFRARIYPIPAAGERRAVLSYTELLPLADGVYRYVYPMGGREEVTIQEFSLRVDLGDEGEGYEVSTLQDARVEKDRSAVTMRRSGFVPRSDFLLELAVREKADALRVVRYSTGGNEADYVMLRYSPEVEWDGVEDVPGEVVVVLDTSAGGDDSERQVRFEVAEAILRSLSSGDRFAVLASDLTPRVVHPSEGLAPAGEEEVSAAVERLSEVSSAGATDLGEMFNAALELVHECEQPAVVYVGDGRATVGETSPDELTERLRRSLGDSRARLFTIAVGADADHGLLERLSRVGGGRSFRVDAAEQAVQEALRFAGMLKTPTVTELEVDLGAGLDQVFSTASGKVSEGEEVVLLARTHHALPEEAVVRGRLGGEAFERRYEVRAEEGAEHGYAPSLWARMYLERLMGEGVEETRGRIISLGLGYGLMTPYTSFLVLESDAAYEAQGIERRRRHRWSMADDRASDAPALGPQLAAAPLLLSGCADLEMAEGVDREAPPADKSEYAPRPAAAPVAVEEEPASHAQSTAVMKGAPVDEVAEDGVVEVLRAGDVGVNQEELDALLGGALRGTGRGGGGAGEGTIGLNGKSAAGGVSGTGTGYGASTSSRARRAPSGASRAAEVLGALEKVLGTAGPEAEKRDAGELRIASEPDDGRQERPLFRLKACSDASRRSLWQRRVLWGHRLDRAADPSQYRRVFFEAGERCELPSWRDRKTLLDMIEGRARAQQEVRVLLAAFGGYPALQSYLRRRVVRRALDPDLTMGLYFPSGVNWHAVRRGLAAMKKPEDRVKEIEKILERHPDDPVGRGILVELLVEADRIEEARAEAVRLKRDGLAGPPVLEILCELQAEAGDDDEARRTCSELVEFNPDDPVARRRLGDLFLRHGWYGAAYRQYRTLVEALGEDPADLLRLAAAAAGMGKGDEALRIERKVASGDGEPGPRDPRRWARLHSAARLARMILEAGSDEDKKRSLERGLKRTGAIPEPATITLLVWEDLAVGLDIVVEQDGDPVPVAERVAAQETGLAMVEVGGSGGDEYSWKVALSGETLRRAVPFSVITIAWDGERFVVSERRGELAPSAEDVPLAV